MKKNFFLLLIPMFLIFSVNVVAEETSGAKESGAFNKDILAQADIVSLEFTKSNVAYTSKLNNNIIDVEGVILSDELLSNKQKLNEFVQKDVDNFIKILQQRIEVNVPKNKDTFSTTKNLNFVFIDKSGKKLATYSNATWDFEPKDALVADSSATVSPNRKEKKYVDEGFWCDCPSLIKSKEDETEIQPVDSEAKPEEEKK